jgi:protein-tyrosine-phosphatase/DNA-binding transcriptional ArsR family regulator
MYLVAVMSSSHVPEPPAFVQLAAHPLRWQLLTALVESDYRVRELVSLLEQPQNLLSYHLRLLREGGLVSASRSSLDRCAHALAETGAALHPDLGPTPRNTSAAGPPGRLRRRPTAVLFVCTGNSIRSPIAEALLRHHGGTSVSATSAGTRPHPQLHRHTARILREQFGIDVADEHPRDLTALAGRRFDHVVTLCDRAREACPAFTHAPRRTHWSIRDPAATGGSGRASYSAFQQVAVDIDVRIRHLLPSLTTPGTEPSP